MKYINYDEIEALEVDIENNNRSLVTIVTFEGDEPTYTYDWFYTIEIENGISEDSSCHTSSEVLPKFLRLTSENTNLLSEIYSLNIAFSYLQEFTKNLNLLVVINSKAKLIIDKALIKFRFFKVREQISEQEKLLFDVCNFIETNNVEFIEYTYENKDVIPFDLINQKTTGGKGQYENNLKIRGGLCS